VHVRWLRAAVANLIAETEYIARDNPAAAARVELSINQGVEKLRRFPSLGRPGRVSGTRELVIPGTPYIVPYRVRNGTLEILRVYHAARRCPKKF
jgi:toxin ParE1/3/4